MKVLSYEWSVAFSTHRDADWFLVAQSDSKNQTEPTVSVLARDLLSDRSFFDHSQLFFLIT